MWSGVGLELGVSERGLALGWVKRERFMVRVDNSFGDEEEKIVYYLLAFMILFLMCPCSFVRYSLESSQSYDT